MAGLPATRHLLRARDLADRGYAEPLRVADLAREAGLSPAQFSRAFRRAFGETPHQYLVTRRMERAARLLTTTDRSVTEICMEVGWSSVGSFTTTFRRIHGVTPRAYRAACPPERLVRIPACIARSYGRPRHRSFREDDAAPAPYRHHDDRDRPVVPDEEDVT